VIGMALPLMFASLLQAQDVVPAAAPASAAAAVASTTPIELAVAAPEATVSPEAAPKRDEAAATVRRETPSNYDSRWFVRAGALGAFYNSHAVFSSNGVVLPGANASAADGGTLSFDVGYDVTDKVAVMLMGGIPPRVAVSGKGSIAPLDTLGAVRYGPIFLTAVYRLPEWRGLRPYVGGGGVHAFILRSFDGSVKQLTVNDSWGSTLQAGVEYRLDRKWAAFLDYKRVWLDVKAKGQLADFPVRGRVTLDPDVVAVGLKFHFG
jgi:outer membrane protein